MGVSKLKAQTGGGTDWSEYITVPINVRNQANTINGSFTDIFTVTGEGILTQLQFYATDPSFHLVLVIDGVEKTMGLLEGAASTAVRTGGHFRTGNTISTSNTQSVNGPIPFKTSLSVRVRNISAGPSSSDKIATGIVLLK